MHFAILVLSVLALAIIIYLTVARWGKNEQFVASYQIQVNEDPKLVRSFKKLLNNDMGIEQFRFSQPKYIDGDSIDYSMEPIVGVSGLIPGVMNNRSYAQAASHDLDVASQDLDVASQLGTIGAIDELNVGSAAVTKAMNV